MAEDVYFKGKIWRSGNSYVVTIPAAIIEAGLVKEGEIRRFKIKELYVVKEEIVNEQDSTTDLG